MQNLTPLEASASEAIALLLPDQRYGDERRVVRDQRRQQTSGAGRINGAPGHSLKKANSYEEDHEEEDDDYYEYFSEEVGSLEDLSIRGPSPSSPNDRYAKEMGKILRTLQQATADYGCHHQEGQGCRRWCHGAVAEEPRAALKPPRSAGSAAGVRTAGGSLLKTRLNRRSLQRPHLQFEKRVLIDGFDRDGTPLLASRTGTSGSTPVCLAAHLSGHTSRLGAAPGPLPHFLLSADKGHRKQQLAASTTANNVQSKLIVRDHAIETGEQPSEQGKDKNLLNIYFLKIYSIF